MCNNCVEEIKSVEVKVEELVNIQTGKKINMEIYNGLKDNTMLKVKPRLWIEWDFEKNDELGFDIYKMTKASRSICWWICKDCGEPYDMRTYNKTKGKGCRYCSGKKVNITNCLATKNPQLTSEWHPTLNENLTPYDVTCGESRIVWWLCPKCNESYEMSLNDRTSKKCNCPYCKGRRVSKSNSLQAKNPKIALQWHPTKNGNKTPDKVTYQSNEVAWWLCGECGYEWENAIKNRRNSDTECPECSKLFNKAPHIAKLLLNKEDGNYTIGSNVKVDWKCSCGQIIKNKSINLVSNKGLSCPNCSDGKSYPEKFMYNVLKQLNVNFEWEKTFEWSDGKRYDFYLEYNGLKILIECHGQQHYEQGFEGIGGRTLKEEQENDKLKYGLAMKNEIDEYIVVDCRESIANFIKNSIIKNEILTRLLNFNIIDWNKVYLDSEKSLILKVNEMWNDGLQDIGELSKETNLCKATISLYLKRGRENGWNNYCPKKAKLNGSESVKKKVIKIDKNNNYIKTYSSIVEASIDSNVESTSITKVCKGKRKSAGGFLWRYEEDVINWSTPIDYK